MRVRRAARGRGGRGGAGALVAGVRAVGVPVAVELPRHARAVRAAERAAAARLALCAPTEHISL